MVSYDAEWPAAFAREVARIAPAFGEGLVAIHHIGSTSVPGLAAKPILDMLPEVTDIAVADAAAERLEVLGYEGLGAYGIPGRRYFRRTVAGRRTHHMHAFATGSDGLKRHLALRDYLRAHPDEAAAYGALKLRLASEVPDMEAFMDGKDAFVTALEARALAWLG
ncbi:GrpB family protein [Pontivivens ytuae]|uniref:GrpB family protein n=1 Tax=Pontivivens ytuae TaxID=2789856 RepID=UPI001E2CAD5B|nr:GrpB family protein [Pontivivens ytuae]